MKIPSSIKAISLALTMSSIFSITGCGGGGGGGGTAASPNGIYTGSITGGQGANGFNGGEKAAIYNGKMLLLSTPGNIQQIFEIPFTTSGTNVNGSLKVYDNSTPIVTTSTVTGNFVENQSATLSFTDLLEFNGSIATNTTPGTINLNAKTAGYNQGADLSLFTNSGWTGPHGGGGNTTSIQFNANGGITGNDTKANSDPTDDCTFTGTASIPDTSKNLYIISITTVDVTNCISLPPSTYKGFAWFDEGDNNTLNFIVTDGSRARAIILTRN